MRQRQQAAQQLTPAAQIYRENASFRSNGIRDGGSPDNDDVDPRSTITRMEGFRYEGPVTTLATEQEKQKQRQLEMAKTERGYLKRRSEEAQRSVTVALIYHSMPDPNLLEAKRKVSRTEGKSDQFRYSAENIGRGNTLNLNATLSTQPSPQSLTLTSETECYTPEPALNQRWEISARLKANPEYP